MTAHTDSSSGHIEANLAGIRARIAAAAARSGREPEAIRLVAVTKAVGLEEAKALIALGVQHLGENRVEVAREKIDLLGDTATWHMIGSIQRRKVKDVARLFDYVDSVDRLSLAESLDRHNRELGKTMPIAVQVNVSGEESKQGFAPENLQEALDTINALEHVSVRGLMTMAPATENVEETRRVFRRLKELADQHDIHELSMGMTNDFEIAIEEGATEVRIGTALYT